MHNVWFVSARSLPFINVSPGEGGLLPTGWGRIFTTGIDYIKVTFLVELLEWCRTFSGFPG